MTTVTINNTNIKEEIEFKDLEVGDAYYTLEYPDIPCIKVTNELCLFYDINFNRWDKTKEGEGEPVVKIDAEIKFTY